MAHSVWFDKQSNFVETMDPCIAKMAMHIYWTWEKEWVKALQVHAQRVTIWQWLKIFDRLYQSDPAPRFTVSIDSRGVYVLNAPSFRIVSMRARSYAFDNYSQNSSPYSIQDICDSTASDSDL